jgi:adenine-specific DNA-methyltransferase
LYVQARDRIEKRVAETRELLRQLGLPKQQQNERSAYTLLALLDLPPTAAWHDARNPQLGVRPIMDWMSDFYKKVYAENSRESIRRYTLHQFIQAGLVVQNPDGAVAVNSSKNVYQVPDEVLVLIQTWGAEGWTDALDGWDKLAGSLQERWAAEREMSMVPVTLPDGRAISLTAGGQNPLIKAVVEEFAPRFAPGGRILYLGDAGEKYVVEEKQALADAGVVIDEHGKMPDVVIHDTERDWMFLVEAVTSHGPMSPLRKADLEDLFDGSTAGLVFVTAFPDRGIWSRFNEELAWETEVWLADSPSHLVHLNGDRFLGPR